jgi:hypothetical protein
MTATLNPGFRPPRFSHTSVRIRPATATPNGPPSLQRPGQDRVIRAASSGTSSSIQPIGFPQTLAQMARTVRTHCRQQFNLSGLRF